MREFRVKAKELTKSKHRRLSKFLEKGNKKIALENIDYNSQTRLTNLWINLGSGWGNCWLPLDGVLTGNQLERIENIKIIEDQNGYKALLSFKKIERKVTGGTVETMSVASVKVLSELKCGELPQEIRKIRANIPLSRAYKITTGNYAGFYIIKALGYHSPPLSRTDFDCGIYDGEGRLVGV